MNENARMQPQKVNAAASAGIVVRKCSALEEFHACVKLQQEVWDEEDLEIEPSTMFVVASLTGGQVLGAFDGDALVGFTMAVVGERHGAVYLHSHQTAVDVGYRNRGIGRMLKLFQRQEALGRGIRFVEWTFDPLELKNAHFNLNRLGAICRRYIPNLYGVTTSPLHRGIATDRLVAEWWLDSPRVIAAIQDLAPKVTNAPATIELPTDLDLQKHEDSQRLRAVQTQAGEEFTKWFAREYAAIAVKAGEKSTAYLLAPWSDF